MNERELAVAALYQSVRSRTELSAHNYGRLIADWDVIPLWSGGEIIGAILKYNAELHVGVTRKPRGSMRKYIRQVLVKTIAQYGYAVTSVAAENLAGIDLCERLGFTVIESTEELVILRCERARYA